MIIKLKYMGNGQYIAMIAKRDLTDLDIEQYCHRDGKTEQELIDELCSHGLYQVHEEFACDICGKPLKSNKALIRHELQHIEKSAIAEKEDDNGNSINSTKETDTDRQ